MLHQQLVIACMLLAAFSEAKSTHKRTSVVVPPSTECSDGLVKCQSSDKCIPRNWICDGDNDCGDNSDEPDSCYTRECIDRELKCNNGQCIHMSDYCYGVNRCRDGTSFTPVDCPHVSCDSDEVKCTHMSKCIQKRYVCDGYIDCADMSDEPSDCSDRQCATGEVRCNNGQCLNLTYVCVGGYSCRDDSTLYAVCDSSTCPVGWIPCSSGDKCIEESLLCDGIAQCSDESDESVEHCDRPLECDSTLLFRCRKIRQCIVKSFLCDTDNDCRDNSDEEESFCNSRTCESNQVRCNNGQCLGKEAYCGGYSTCRDNSLANTSDICESQANEQQTDSLPSSPDSDAQQLSCFMAMSQIRQLCGVSPVEEMFQGLSNKELYDKLVGIDLKEICSPLQPWLGCVASIFKECDENIFPMLSDIKKTLKAAEIALNYVCVKEIDAINSHKSCLLKENDQLLSTSEPVPELAVRLNRTCSHLTAQINPTMENCFPSDLQSCVKQVVADQCGNEIATTLEVLYDRVHDALNCPGDRVRSHFVNKKHTDYSMYKRFFKSFF